MRQFVTQTVVASAVSLLFLGIYPAQAGGLENAIEKNLEGMVNVTSPGTFETLRRGVVSGGSVYYRTPISNVQLVSVTAPSFRSGCGGIDAYFGSLSFINKDQLISLLRNIAANSPGYLFSLALDSVSPKIATWVAKFQQVVQDINSLNATSCTMSQGLLTNTFPAMKKWENDMGGLWGATKSLFTDANEAMNSNMSAVSQVLGKADDKTKSMLMGNVVWTALFDGNIDLNSLSGMFGNFSGHDATELAQLFMSASGTVVVPEPKQEGDSGDTTQVSHPYQGILSLEALVEANSDTKDQTYTVYECDSLGTTPKDCLHPRQTTKNGFVGMKQRIEKILLGDRLDGSGGVVSKWSIPNSTQIQFSQEEQALIMNIAPQFGTMLRNLSLNGRTQAAVSFVHAAAGAVAYDFTYRLLSTMINTVSTAVSANQLAKTEHVEDVLARSRTELDRQYQHAMRRYPSISELGSQYTLVMSLSERGLMNFDSRGPSKVGFQ